MDKESISRHVLVGRDHQAVIDRRPIEGLPGMFGEVRIRRGWKVDFELMCRPEDDSGPIWVAQGTSLDDAVDLVEELLNCKLGDCDPNPVQEPNKAPTQAGSVAAAILEGRLTVPKQFKLRTWLLSTGDYWVRLGSGVPS